MKARLLGALQLAQDEERQGSASAVSVRTYSRESV